MPQLYTVEVVGSSPLAPTKEDVFEQVVDFSLSDQCLVGKELFKIMAEEAGSFLDIR